MIVKALRHIAPWLFIGLASAVFCLPLFRHPENWGRGDWDIALFLQAGLREALLRYGQWPLWNPYYCGGSEFMAHHFSHFPTPIFAIELVFGTVLGAKISIVAYLAIGMAGVYQVCRRIFGLEAVPSLTAACIAMLSGTYAFHLAEGHINHLSYCYLPWVYLFLELAFERLRFAPLAGIFLALAILEGGYYSATHTALFATLLSIFRTVQSRSPAPGAALALLASCAFMISAPKLLPAMEFFLDFPRVVDSDEYTPFSMLVHSLLARDQHMELRLPQQAHGWWEYAAYIGHVPLLLGLAGAVRSARRYWPLVMSCLAFLLLSIGDFHSWSPWNLLHRLPIWSSHHVPSRFIFGFVVLFSILAGIAASEAVALLARRTPSTLAPRLAGLALLLWVAIDLIRVNSKAFESAFIVPPYGHESSGEFRQTIGEPFHMYSALLQKRGTLNCYASPRGPAKALPDTSPDYRGELYLIGSGSASYTHWSYDRLSVRVAGQGILCINQNFAPGWRSTDGREVFSHGGIVATRVSDRDSEVILEYRPGPFRLGLALSGLCLLATIAIFLSNRSKAGK